MSGLHDGVNPSPALASERNSASTVNILFGGDMSFDLEMRQVDYCGAWKRRDENEPHVADIRNAAKKNGGAQHGNRITRKLSRIWKAVKIDRTRPVSHFQELLIPIQENRRIMSRDVNTAHTVAFDIRYPEGVSKYDYPFQKIKTAFRSKDMVIMNLETPLTSRRRPQGLFISDPGYARAMFDAGITAVNLANNHIFDAGEPGFLDTLTNLGAAGVSCIGAGSNMAEARSGKAIDCQNHRFLFLSYTQFCNNKFSSVAADYPGILPLDRQVMVEDIESARNSADFIIVSLHWGKENTTAVHARQREIARRLIDAGADAIVGHHPHIPQGIEIYKDKPVFYSLGNFIFGQGDIRWKTDNYLAELVIQNKRIEEVRLHAVSGRDEELFQPYILNGERAGNLFSQLNTMSEPFGTQIEVSGNKGRIRIH